MKYNFCTLFDKNYLTRGLVLYNSLLLQSKVFHLWILCLDQETFDLLSKLNFKNITLIKLVDIEDAELLVAKNNRSHGEYCWTLGSVFTHYVLNTNPELNHITYLDSDMYFYSPPQPIYDEMGKNSVLIIKHNYVQRLKYLEKKGLYNVAMVVFKNDDIGKACIKDWKNDCIQWCYNKDEEGRFGDQKYLDYWSQKYQNVHILKHKGGDVAPWNVEQYKITEKNNQIFIDEDLLIFYHFHTFKIITDNKFILYSSFYSLDKQVKKYIYEPYIKEIQKAIKMVKDVDLNFSYDYNKSESFIEKIKQLIKRFLVTIYYSNKK